MEERKKQLLELVNNDPRFINIIDEMLYLENELSKLRRLPKIIVMKDDLYNQKQTVAAKMYKEYLQQYTNVIKLLSKELSKEENEDDESPLRVWLKNRKEYGIQNDIEYR